ncbi:MAG: cytochrome c oxidase assembly protein [Gammaproteobacteria bacterium]|nr:cytochrome c oxidase assembly protein [Gammaproteobacteria bacterium]
MEQAEIRKATRGLVARLTLVAVGMFGFGFALVPLYDVFCDLTGINGKTGRVDQASAEATQVDESRWVTVEFVANVSSGLPWTFRPEERRIRVHPGEVAETVFFARNATSVDGVGQAVPSVAPSLAAKYFSKTECFCFSQQPLNAGELKEMPVKFIVDPRLPKDITTITLAYTFFESKQPAVEAEIARTEGRPDSG